MGEVLASGPSGTVTMLFTDIEGSTAAARALEHRWPEVLAAHHRILEEVILRHDGFVEGTEGDAFFATFASPRHALAAARDGQTALRAHRWPGSELRVRMGVHTGVLQRTATGATGLEVHRAARISAAAHGRQVVVSSTTRALAPDEGVFENLGEHRLKDFPQSERLFHFVVGGVSREAFGPLRTLPVRPTNILALESPVIGRERELERVRDLLCGGAHLVTVTGRGGTGKTRLAMAAGVEMLDVFPGGSWFVPLADVQEPEQLLVAVADRVGVDDGLGSLLLAGIAERLQSAATLLILDNLEQVRDAASTIDRVLAAAPTARVLATSQVPLHLRREHVLALAPLSSSSGVRLFVERAARQGGEGVTDGMLGVVSEICERLDGLPLAIELAAARTIALTPEEILRRLSDSLSLLTSRERDRPERHRSLRATIGWSLSQLEPEDAELFATLSVFADTFTLADADAVAGIDVLDGLEALVESSFLRRVATQNHAARFTMAQALREFGREQLISAGRLQSIRAAHARWVLTQAEAAWEALISDARDFSAPVADLGDDARTALAYLRDHEPLLHLQLIGAYAATATEYALATSLAAELDHAIAASDKPGAMLARAHLSAGEISWVLGQPEAAMEHLSRARELAVTYGPTVVAGLALGSMASVMLASGAAGARVMAEEAVRETEATGEGRTWAIIALAQVDVGEGRVEVEPLLAELLARTKNNDHLLAIRHLYADCALLRSDGPAAVERYAQSLRATVARYPDINPFDLEGVAMGLAAAGRPRDAIEVDAIAQAHRAALRSEAKFLWWDQLRDRFLGPIRETETVPDRAWPTDLGAALARALALADGVAPAD